MMCSSTTGKDASELALQVYLLGTVDFETMLRFQRRLHFDVCDQRIAAALVICEHPPTISVGRLGSHAHIRTDTDSPQLPLRWVNRGGGCILHMPGQLAVYPIFPLDRLGLDIAGYVQLLGETCLGLISEFSLRTAPHADAAGVWVGNRLLAILGISVREWVTSFGAYINIQPDLDRYRLVQTVPADRDAVTSLECERRGPVRPAMVRQRLVEHFQAAFGFGRTALFSDHPVLAGAVERSRDLAQDRGASAGHR